MAKKRKDRKVPRVPAGTANSSLRTQDEIVERFKEKQKEFLNFEPEVLIDFLDLEHFKPLLKPDAEFDEKKWTSTPYTRDVVLKQAKKYMREFGWPKCQGHRGISADRSVQKMTAWAWLLGEDKLLDTMKTTRYQNYGAPILNAVCEHFGWPIPNDKPTQRMIRGLPCRDDCEEGCGK